MVCWVELRAGGPTEALRSFVRTRDCLPAALQKAERYRLINDPTSAESICLDVLTVDPENRQALMTLLLAITDQFGEAPTDGVRRA